MMYVSPSFNSNSSSDESAVRYITDDLGAWERLVSGQKTVPSYGRLIKLLSASIDEFDGSVWPFSEDVKGSTNSDASSLLQSLS
jgi:hypothetical protein